MQWLKLLFIMLFNCIMPLVVLSQGVIQGKVTDAETGEPLFNVNVVVDASKGWATVTDIDGNYRLELPAGIHTVTFTYIGYQDQSRTITLRDGETYTINIEMSDQTIELGLTVVSASKYEKKLSEETVSIEVLKNDLIENANAVSMDEAMNKVPGVVIVDGQANIRGGSGWSYGAGSRVMMLVDDMPLLAADAADVKWSFIPTENTEQVEVIKGAASALYGSSALNGIINVRTAWPKSEPYTRLKVFHGFYQAPKNKDMKWWDDSTGTGSKPWIFRDELEESKWFGNQPLFFGTNVAHRQRFGNFDLVLGGHYFVDRSYLYGHTHQRYRMSVKTRYRFKGERSEGLSLGLNLTAYQSRGSVFFLWDGYPEKALLPLPGSVSNFISNRIAVDPWVTYIDQRENKFYVRTRFFNATNKNDTEQGSVPNLYFGEFQYQRTFQPAKLNFVTGVSGYYSDVKSPTGNPEESLIGEHQGNNISVYAQVDKKFFDVLSLSLGVRYEYFRIDTFTSDSKPVLRAGVNYQVAEVTYLRASFGQGYRFPTMAEKFVRTSVGGINIYPNPALEPETGWSAELGIKQGVKIRNWLGYVDLAGFINQYNNMMEFNFNRVGEDRSFDNLLGLGFSSQNVGDTRIIGTELTLIGQGDVGGIPLTVLAGYTYINPKSLNWDDPLKIYDENGKPLSEDDLFGSDKTYKGTSTSEENILKYRNEHMFKADIEASIKRFDVGFSAFYTSYMKNIDAIFVSDFIIGFEPTLGTQAFSGLKKFREENQKGDWVLDARVAFHINDKMQVGFLVKNILNEFITRRPAFPDPPRNYTLQFTAEF